MKLILAIIQEKDEYETVEKLTQHNFFVTKLATTGGFLKEKNVTLMIGVNDEKVQQVIDCIKSTAKTRKTVSYAMPYLGQGALCPGVNNMVPIDVQVGGCTLFVLPVDQFMKC